MEPGWHSHGPQIFQVFMMTELTLESKEKQADSESKTTWFVGASFGGANDQLPRFLSEGIWESLYEDKQLDVVRSMRVGDRIAIKSSYTRRKGLPSL